MTSDRRMTSDEKLYRRLAEIRSLERDIRQAYYRGETLAQVQAATDLDPEHVRAIYDLERLPTARSSIGGSRESCTNGQPRQTARQRTESEGGAEMKEMTKGTSYQLPGGCYIVADPNFLLSEDKAQYAIAAAEVMNKEDLGIHPFEVDGYKGVLMSVHYGQCMCEDGMGFEYDGASGLIAALPLEAVSHDRHTDAEESTPAEVTSKGHLVCFSDDFECYWDWEGDDDEPDVRLRARMLHFGPLVIRCSNDELYRLFYRLRHGIPTDGSEAD